MLHSLWDLFFAGNGLEPIAVELSGGQFLPPVQTLVATSIFAKGENANRVRSPIFRYQAPQTDTDTKSFGAILSYKRDFIENIKVL